MDDTPPSDDPAAAPGYTVLAAPASAEIEVKRSRFLCMLERVDGEEAAREVIARVRQEHRLARHHCSAFLVGPGRELRRSNDDGEPSGTAGAPMLEALSGASVGPRGERDLSDVVAVVVRWFGGVLLGTGGLARAYGDAVSEALHEARFAARRRMRILALEAPHAEAGRWEHELRARGLELLETGYGSRTATLRMAVADAPEPIAHAGALAAEIAHGRALADDGVDWIESPIPAAR
ncbi:IMPACT family member YigZ [Pseudoclavibacter triregionum]|nr:IMPACT family member YigZ [Pseudoclavibacter triregionum]